MDDFNVFRAKILVAWIVTNGFVVVFVEAYVPASDFVMALAALVSLVNLYRFVGCAIFISARTLRGTVSCFCPCCRRRRRAPSVAAPVRESRSFSSTSQTVTTTESVELDRPLLPVATVQAL